MKGSITMDEIVNFYLDEWELPDSSYGRIHSFGVRAYREIYMHASGQPLSVELEVQADKTATLPCDCLNVITVGIMNKQGEISPLTEDSSLGLLNGDNGARTTEPTERLITEPTSEIFYNPNGTYVGNMLSRQMGVGARSDLGFYRLDWKQRLIIFDFNCVYNSVWLEHLPVFNDDETYLVSPFFVEAVISFIGWKDKRRSLSDRGLSKQEYYNSFRIGRRSMKPFNASQVFLQYARTTRIARY